MMIMIMMATILMLRAMIPLGRHSTLNRTNLQGSVMNPNLSEYFYYYLCGIRSEESVARKIETSIVLPGTEGSEQQRITMPL